jgi:hypothetical protein
MPEYMANLSKKISGVTKLKHMGPKCKTRRKRVLVLKKDKSAL